MLGPKEERILMTGLHSVADIYCKECSTRLGWKYLEAFESRYGPIRVPPPPSIKSSSRRMVS